MNKKYLALAALGVVILAPAFISPKKKKQNVQDKEAIKSMCGCYEVSFEFGETFSPDTTYKFHDNYSAGALEWVQLAEERSDFVSMQHILVAQEDMVIKHWRQDWQYENTDFYMFDKDKHWKFETKDNKDVAGQWTQKVYQVDDSPRYEGSATWVHVDGRHFWENTTDTPLPRREYTKRKDYNVMNRRNRHEITASGWIHEQDNKKVLRKDGAKDVVIAMEKGMNTYRKVDDSKCKAAQDWWKENKSFWAVVRDEWAAIFARKKSLKLKKSVDEKPLFMHLFSLKPSQTAEVKPIINKFVEE